MSLRDLLEANLSMKFAKASGIKKDKKQIGNGDVYFLTDGSSIVIGAQKDKLDYYDKNLNFITSYTRVAQAIKALGQSGLLSEISEAKKIPTVGMVKKAIKGLILDVIEPEFFSVEKKNTDAGMGGYNYLYISFDADLGFTSKRSSEVNKVLMTLGNKWNTDTTNVKQGYITIK